MTPEEIEEIVAFLNTQLDEASSWALACTHRTGEMPQPFRADHRKVFSGSDVVAETRSATLAVHIARHGPARILADIESKRQIIREVMSWRHDVVDGDCWFTCGAATEERDGGECCNDNQRDECTCGLDDRREKILSLLAAPFSAEPGYDAERWAV